MSYLNGIQYSSIENDKIGSIMPQTCCYRCIKSSYSHGFKLPHKSITFTVKSLLIFQFNLLCGSCFFLYARSVQSVIEQTYKSIFLLLNVNATQQERKKRIIMKVSIFFCINYNSLLNFPSFKRTIFSKR